jgi:hypothetical protein
VTPPIIPTTEEVLMPAVPTIGEEFEKYLKAIRRGPEPLSEVQVTETRRAFYAGAFVALCRFREIGVPEVDEDEGVARMQAMYDEIMVFYEAVRGGRA